MAAILGKRVAYQFETQGQRPAWGIAVAIENPGNASSTPFQRATAMKIGYAIASLFVVCGAAILTNPTLFFGRDLRWREEVKLPDGRVLVVSRSQEFRGASVPFSPSTESDYWLEFAHPETGETVRYEGSRYLQTILLALDKGTPYLVLAPQFTGFERMSCPDPPYQLFRYQRGHWQWASLDELPIQKFRSNMTRTPEKWRSQLERRDETLKLSVTQALTLDTGANESSRPYVIDLSNAPKQTLFDGRKFAYRDPNKVEETVTDPRELACLSVKQKLYLAAPD